jgi:hypothetical protein
MEQKHMVLSSNYNEDNSLRIRVFNSEKPSDTFKNTESNLEDVYFIALKNS